jgi:glutaredoxin
MDKLVVLFTMEGCPFCVEMKNMLKEQNELFVEITENDYVPAFMLIENYEKEPVSHLFAPDRDYKDIEDGVKIIKEWVEK